MTEMNKRSKKTYVLDTTVLIYDPDIMFKTGVADWVIPLAVIREIDGLKNSDKELVGKAARQIARTLDRFGSYGDLSAGVKLPTGRMLRIYTEFERVDGLASEADNRIVGSAIKLIREGYNVTLFTMDSNMRTVARVYGVNAEHFPLFESGESQSIAYTSSATPGSASPLKKRKFLRIIYPSIMAFIIGFFLVAVIGVYGSLAGFKGPLWKISEICGYIAIVLLIATIILYSAAKRGIRYDADPSDIVVNPVYKDYDINIFHKN